MPARASDPAPARAPSPAEPVAWWAVLLGCYLALVPAVSVTEITVGAVTAAAGAAAAVAARRALLATSSSERDGGRGRGTVPPARLIRPIVRLPAQIVADTARIAVRGASGGRWVTLAAAPGTAGRGVATLLLSASPGTYVGGVDPARGAVRVHRLAGGPSPFERRLRDAGLVGEHTEHGDRGGERS
ncbi:hypothetical protein LUW76_03095 [Actinomadura madurae]|uniref:hypothetical protein n=1 Tax=Actinomadura madurae TaxID=1993 RepID=UPI002026C4BA|nr:hypothetical protein [Actinomadura madurae]MCQ0013173.1 hypothetical protein [Actinomadura madurae]URM93394.1 hypothetical protein LUW76_03095 [Actinomadura madurae]